MRITILGTGTSQGVPVLTCQCRVCKSPDWRDKRLRTSALIETEENNLLIDVGPDFRWQAMRENIDRIDAVLLTHEHRDHVAGLDDIRPFNFLKKQVIDLYATPHVQNELRNAFSYIFSGSSYPGIPRIDLKTIFDDPFEINGTDIIPIQAYHHKLPVLGFRIGDFTYITDANYIDDSDLEKVQGTHTLVLNALQIEEHISHFTLQEAVDLAKKLKVKQAFFTHISHHMGRHEEINKQLPDNMKLAYDGQTIIL